MPKVISYLTWAMLTSARNCSILDPLLFVCNRGDTICTVPRRSPIKGVRPSPYATGDCTATDRNLFFTACTPKLR